MKKSFLRLFRTFLCILIVQNMYGQNNFKEPFFLNYNTNNGMSNNFCNKVVQDKSGYIWVATLNGLNRFNGKSWLHFKQQNKDNNIKLPSNWVIDITVDKDNKVWINTDDGLCYYDSKKKKVIDGKKIITGWGMLAYRNNNQLFSSSFLGIDLNILNPINIQKTYKYYETASNSIFELYLDEKNNLWAGLEDNKKVAKIDIHNKLHIYDIKDRSNNLIYISSFSKYSKDTILMNTPKNGILKYNINTNKYQEINFNNILKKSIINCSYTINQNNKIYTWIGTQNDGLYIIEDNKFLYHYTHELKNNNTICSNTIHKIYEDRQKGLWLATNSGLSYYHESLQKAEHYLFEEHQNNQHKYILNAVYPVNNFQYLLATDDSGVYLFDKYTKKIKDINTNETKSLSFSNIIKVFDDTYYLSSKKGIFLFDNKKQKLVKCNKLKNLETLSNIKILNDSLVGYCTFSGFNIINKFTNKIIYNYRFKNNYGANIYKDIALKGDTIIALKAFAGIELFSLKYKKLIKDITPNFLKIKAIDYYQLALNKSMLYICSTRGIYKYDLTTNKGFIINSKNGLEGDYIANVLIYNHQLYYNNYDGFYLYQNNKSLLLERYENFLQKWYNQLLVLDDKIITTTGNSFMVYDLNNKAINKTKIPINIESISINNQKIAVNNNDLNLKYNQNNIKINLFTNDFIDPTKSKWQYAINQTKNWETTSSGEINLTNLSAGTYKIYVRSFNNLGYISEIMLIKKIVINPIFYKQIWFLVMCICILILILASIYRYKFVQKQKIDTIRRQISRDLHDELGANVSSINIMANLLSKYDTNSNQIQKITTNISLYSQQISDTINDIIWNINPKFDTLEDVLNKIKRYTSTQSKMEVVFMQNKNFEHIKISQIVKYNIYLIIKEIYNNAIKYADANQFIINFIYEDKFLILTLKDNGIGFDINDNSQGNGLNNIQTRAKDLNATIVIESEINIGTTIVLTLKI